jgi:hypothetical protein
MGYALPAHLSFCLVGGRAVFLDLAQDRYFKLEGDRDRLFQALLRSGEGLEADVETLIRLGVIRRAGAGGSLQPAKAAVAKHSVPEMETPGQPAGLGLTLEVALVVAMAGWRLRRMPIARVLARLRARARALSPSGAETEAGPELLALAARFHRARRSAPIDTVCLLDSIALVDFLARRRISARLVMGVKLNPFSAHCWVQHGDVILNEALDRAGAYTPILVI